MKLARLPLRDRFALKWWSLRYSYPFRFAHKPLCDRLGQRVLKIRHVYLCRGCTFLYCGALVASVTTMAFHFPPAARYWLAFGVGMPAFISSIPHLYSRLPPKAMDLSRFLTGAAAVWLAAFLWWGPWWIGALNLAALLVARQVILRMRARYARKACDGCPELGRGTVCSGFTVQAEYARRYEEIASARLTQITMPLATKPGLHPK